MDSIWLLSEYRHWRDRALLARNRRDRHQFYGLAHECIRALRLARRSHA